MQGVSYYQNLSIYKAGIDLIVKIDQIVRNFTRYHKYDMGIQLKQASWKILCLVREANNRETRAQKILDLCDKIEELKLLCNVGKEVQAFSSFKQFAMVMEQVVNLARQAEGWRRSVSSQRPESSKGMVKNTLEKSVSR